MASGDITVRAVIDSRGAATGARQFNSALGTMRKGVEATALSTKSLVSSMASVRGAAAGFIAALAVREIVQLGSAIAKAGDTFTQFKSRLALYAQEGVNATSILDALAEAANRSHAPVSALADVYSRNAAALNNLGLSTADQIRLNETLYKALVVSGNATESGREALIQFSQSLNSGVFRGQEFNSVNEQATEIIRILARETGKTQGELRKLANKGMLTAQVAVNALLNGSKELDAEFARMPQTVSQAASQFSSALTLVVGQSSEATGSNRALAGAISEWTSLINSSAGRDIIDYFSEALKGFADYAADAAREIRVMNAEIRIAAEEAAKQKESGFWDSALGKGLRAAGTITKMGLGFWVDQAKNLATGTFGMTPEQQRAIRAQAEAEAGWETTIKRGDISAFDTNQKKLPIQFGTGQLSDEEIRRRDRIIAQIVKQTDLEKLKIGITKAQIEGDTTQVQTLETQMEIRRRISDEMRRTAPEKAKALENEILNERALEVQLKAVQEVQERNNQFADDFAGAITNGFESAIKGGQSFSQTLKAMAVDLLDVITKAAVLEPLGRSIGKSLSGALNGGSFGSGFDIGNIFGGLFGGGNVGLGSWAPTVTAFASGGVVNKPRGFAFDGGFGVAGENGPEAILPLMRGPNGDLGVRASGTGGSNVSNTFNFTITGDATDATIAKMRAAAEQMFAQKTPDLIDRAKGAVAQAYRNDKNYLRR